MGKGVLFSTYTGGTNEPKSVMKLPVLIKTGEGVPTGLLDMNFGNVS